MPIDDKIKLQKASAEEIEDAVKLFDMAILNCDNCLRWDTCPCYQPGGAFCDHWTDDPKDVSE